MGSYAPPLPPDVLRQQQGAPMSPAMQFMSRGGAAPAQGQPPNLDAGAIIKDRMTQAVTLLKEVSDLVQNFKPAALPYLVVMVKAGSEFMNRLEEGEQPSPPGSQVQAQMPQAQDAAGAISMG